MADIKDKVVTVESLSALHEHNKETYIAKTGGTMSGTLILSNASDISGTSYNAPALIVGGTPSQPHISFDSNEIIAKSDENTPTTLYLGETDSQSIVSISGIFRLNNQNFGTTLPDAGNAGRIFFKRVIE